MARRKRYLEEDINNTNQITEESHAEVETAGPETINGVIINALLVNVRKGPSTDSEVVEILRKGDKVSILGTEKGYYKVTTSVNKEVYISSYFVVKEE